MDTDFTTGVLKLNGITEFSHQINPQASGFATTELCELGQVTESVPDRIFLVNGKESDLVKMK